MNTTKFSRNERFWAKVQKEARDECWPWVGGQGGPGYGYFEDVPAHRVAYELLVGPIPEGLTIDHLCRNKLCVNPAHLEPVTLRVNILRSDNPFAVNARKIACIHGHPFTGDNLIVRPQGGRACRTCVRAADAALRERLRREPIVRSKPCRWGHPIDETDAQRRCLTCRRASNAASVARRKARAS